MKKCSYCKLEKYENEFHKNSFKKDGLASYCKECNTLWVRRRYLRNPEYYKQKNKDVVERNRIFIMQYLSDKSCIDCGENDIRVLEFDHMDHKVKEVSHMITGSYCIKTIESEISKCTIRCANCHRKKTSSERGYYKAKTKGL